MNQKENKPILVKHDWIEIEDKEEAIIVWYDTCNYIFSHLPEVLERLEFMKEFKVPWNKYKAPKILKTGKKLHFGVGKPPKNI